ncbi:MAG: hypothetical protein Q4P29_04735 [Tissierellia bacterium]|nr:hypothetical protein [Tissierellia bacterium]
MKADLYLFAGFLFAGKSTIINKLKNSFENILIISMEQGLEKVDQEIYFNNLTDAKDYLKTIDLSKYDAIFMEYNGTMHVKNIFSFAKDLDLVLRKTIYVLDGEVAENYLINMPNLILEQINFSDLIYIRNFEKFQSDRAKEIIKTLKPGIKIYKDETEIENIFEKKNYKILIIIIWIILILSYKFILKK